MTTTYAQQGTAQGNPGSIDKLLRSLDTVVTLPEITTRIAAVINDQTSSASDLHRIISHDPALVARILRLVNSAFYGRESTIDSVGRAIVLLGFEGVYHLSLAATMGAMFKGGKICERFAAKDLWTHCVAVAAVARDIASLIGWAHTEEAFLAGLLHDIGLLVALRACRGPLRQACELTLSSGGQFTNIETQVIGAGHAELGAALAKQWKFPAGVREIAHYHHRPMMAAEALRPLAIVTHMADTLCCQHRVGFYLTADKQQLDENIYRDLIPPAVVSSARERLPATIASAIEIFS